MRLLRLLLTLLVLFSMAGVTSAIAGGPNIVVVTNSTSYTMSEFYVSPSDNSTFDTTNNLISGQTILPGQTTTIDVSSVVSNHDGCSYDLMGVLYGATQYAYRYRVDPCDGAIWTITP
jgi:hypothetical protein